MLLSYTYIHIYAYCYFIPFLCSEKHTRLDPECDGGRSWRARCPTFRLTSLSFHFPSSFLDFLELPAANLHTESMSCYGIIFQLSCCHVLERNRWFPCPEDLVLTVLYPSSHASPAVLWLVLIGLEDCCGCVISLLFKHAGGRSWGNPCLL